MLPVAFFLLSVFPLVTVSYACPPPLHWQYKASRVSMAFIVACRSCRRKGWPRGRVGVWDFIRSWLPPVDVVGEEMRVGVSAPSKSVTSTIALVGSVRSTRGSCNSGLKLSLKQIEARCTRVGMSSAGGVMDDGQLPRSRH
jgi:hypothetical protein